MPYYRRRSYSRPYPRYRANYRSVNSRQNARLNYLTKKVNSMQKSIELKFNDVSRVTTVDSASGDIFALNLVAQGDNFNTRDGAEIICKSALVRGSFTVADSYNIIRMMLIWDTDPNGAYPVLSDILEAPANPTHSAIAIDSTKRFVVLHDRMYKVDTDDPVVNFKFYKKLNHKSTFSGTAAAISSLDKGGLYLFCVSDSSAATHPGLTCYTRLRYTS